MASRRIEITALCRRFGVRRLDAFGSAVRDSFDPGSSDLDVLVEFVPLPAASYAHAFFSLKEGLERLFGLPVDLVTLNSLVNPHLRERVISERRNLYAG